MEIFQMIKNIFSAKALVLLLGGIILVYSCGCEEFRDAMEAEMEYGSSEKGNSDDFRPRFVLAMCSVVRYPRAQMLEQQVDCNGQPIWINTNQLFDSKRIRKARAVPRPGNPDVCDLELRLDPLGKNHWQMLVASSRGGAVALMVDKRCVGTFIPEMPNVDGDRFEWVNVRIGVDSYTARGIVRYAGKNYDHFNPEASSFFGN